MLEYRHFCYLDTEKSGSTFIRRFLRRHVADRPLNAGKHKPPRHAYRWRKFYFSSCRDPFDQYASLYSFGCGKKGGLYVHLAHTAPEMLGHYDYTAAGFERWLGAMLSDSRLPLMPPSTAPFASLHLGMLGTRFLRLNLRGAKRRLAAVTAPAQISRAYRRARIPEEVIRTEELNTALASLIERRLAPHFRDPDAALRELRTPKVENASDRSLELSPERISPELLDRLQSVEWFHFEHLGYQRYR